jgi:PAS domain S-box-containing protein
MSKQLSQAEKQEKLKTVIRRLYRGDTVDQVKKEFHALIKNVSAEEISAMEQALLNEGFPAEEIQRLCEVHVEVFKNSLAGQRRVSGIPGHPLHSFLAENSELKRRIRELTKLLPGLKKQKADPEHMRRFKQGLKELEKVEFHYRRKENQLFPFLEQKGFTGPSKVMWGKHNEIRRRLKLCGEYLDAKAFADLAKECGALFSHLRKMIFMEEKILFPTALKKLSEQEWARIRKGEPEIGYAWIKPGNVWDADIVLQTTPEQAVLDKARGAGAARGAGHEDAGGAHTGQDLDVGRLSVERINLMLKSLPFDVTYVDENDTVLYYSAGAERIFPRSPAVIGRKVQNCHPQASVHVVNRILKAFREKKQKKAEFWISMNKRVVYIRYFPLYDAGGDYKGVIEVTQDITEIKDLEGERRLLDW